MSLAIDIDPHGYQRIPFVELRTRLLAVDQPFTERELRFLPYNDLVQAAIANAGSSACTMEDALREKVRRRCRFINMSPDELPKAKRYLQVEGMYPDISTHLQMRQAPHWDALSPRVRLWFRLNCLYTHCDTPNARIRDTYTLVLQCVRGGLLRDGFAERLTTDLDRMLWLFMDAFHEDEFRYISGYLAEELLLQLDGDEKYDCERELVTGYSCTGNCYQAMGELD